MAQFSLVAEILGFITTLILVKDHGYRIEKLAILDNLYRDIVIEYDILSKYEYH